MTDIEAKVRERAARLKLPNKSAIVFPRLEPVMEGSEIKDVRLFVWTDSYYTPPIAYPPSDLQRTGGFGSTGRSVERRPKR